MSAFNFSSFAKRYFEFYSLKTQQGLLRRMVFCDIFVSPFFQLWKIIILHSSPYPPIMEAINLHSVYLLHYSFELKFHFIVRWNDIKTCTNAARFEETFSLCGLLERSDTFLGKAGDIYSTYSQYIFSVQG